MGKKNILSPAELFDYRLAALHGYLDPDVMKAAMPHRVYAGWQKYWNQEPWGPWRDNLHTGIIARELRRSVGGRSTIDTFMVRHPDERAEVAKSNFFTSLGVTALQVTAKEAGKKLKSLRDKVKKRKKS